jgi:hypothetical protein
VKLEELVAAGETMHQELGREYYLTGAGLKTEPEFQAIYERHEAVGGDEALSVARRSGSDVLLEWVLGIRIGRKVASLEERQLSWERDAVVTACDREVPYLRVPIELANSPDRAFRTALDEARTHMGVAALTPIHKERLLVERDEVQALGIGDYVEAVGALAGIDLDALGRSAEKFLADTADMYSEVLAHLVRRRMGVGLAEILRSDTSWTFRADQYDSAFAPDRMVEIAMSQMREMGLDATQSGRVHFDTEERPAKQPRAFCVPVQVPGEVYLVLRPSGGHSDYRTFWHELGHAMHFASVDPALPFTARWLGDNSVTEGFAMLWDHLTLQPTWLTRYTDIGHQNARELVVDLAISELHLLRRYAAKLTYELVLHRSDLDAVGDEYAERLTRATRFRYQPENYLNDVDAGFYAARYLRAWQLEAGLAATLRERYNEDWWRNPRAGSFVLHLMSRGQVDPAHRLAHEVVGADLSFAACLERLEAVLN